MRYRLGKKIDMYDKSIDPNQIWLFYIAERIDGCYQVGPVRPVLHTGQTGLTWSARKVAFQIIRVYIRRIRMYPRVSGKISRESGILITRSFRMITPWSNGQALPKIHISWPYVQTMKWMDRRELNEENFDEKCFSEWWLFVTSQGDKIFQI